MPSLRVSKIENGTVIDHIPAGNAMKLLRLLSIEDDGENILSLIMNVDSRQLGRKDILKIEGKELDALEVQSAGLFAPNATINIVEDYDIVEKERIEVPDTVEAVIDCPNPDCVTNADEPVQTLFDVVARDPVELECRYCESRFGHDDLDLPRF